MCLFFRFLSICVIFFYLSCSTQYTPTLKDSLLSRQLNHQEEQLAYFNFDEDEELDEEDEDLPSFLQNDRSRRFVP